MAERTPSTVDEVADRHVATVARLDPFAATGMGIAGHDHEVPDLSPAGLDARADAARATLRALDAAAHRAGQGGRPPLDEVDAVTLAAMRERLGLELELYEAGELHASLNVIASPAQEMREVFDLMPTDTVEQWADIAARLSALPDAAEGYTASLRAAAQQGLVAARRQVAAVLEQATELADPESSFFTAFVAGARSRDGELPAALRADLERGAERARAAYGRLAEVLRDEIASRAPERDAVGRDRYALWSRAFLGARIDLEETYSWGLDRLAQIVAEQERVAAQIAGPGTTIDAAIAQLDADPERVLHGTAALQEWMQATSDAAVTALHGTHFDIPEPMRALECRIAPTQTGGIYYTPPSDDFSRPGRMWWSVPEGVTEFTTWRERTTVYHEGVPGHHLQIGQAVYERERLNSWRRLACWVSGHGEGWALYAERLMADLGFLDDPGDRMGMLVGQRLRATRVALDIGVHLGLPHPDGGTWDPENAWAFLTANVSMDEAFLRFELDRYLGWPGQAPSYLVGQRLWEQTRAAAQAAAADRAEPFDLAAFHASVLRLGSVGLDVLHDVVSGAGEGT